MSLLRRMALAAALTLCAGTASATDIDLFFPVPVQGRLSTRCSAWWTCSTPRIPPST